MDYVPVEQAKSREGLRIATVQGLPSPWSESVKGICAVKELAFTPIAQQVRGANPELVAWTGHRNAPVVVYNDELPRTGWAEILILLERLAPAPALIPADPSDRALMFGLAHEIAGEDGLGWNRRLSMIASAMAGSTTRQADPAVAHDFVQRYGIRREAIERADARTAQLLAMLADRLEAQQSTGSDYLVGQKLSAADIYLAYFSQLVAPLPDEHCPLTPEDRARWTHLPDMTQAALSPALIAHRDRIFHQFLPLPLDFN